MRIFTLITLGLLLWRASLSAQTVAGQVVYEEIPEQFAARFDQRLSEREMRVLSRRLRTAAASQRTPQRADADQKSMVPQESPAADE